MSQPNDLISHCEKIEKEDAHIDPHADTITDIYRKYRAYALWPKLFWMEGTKRIIIEHLVLDPELYQSKPTMPLLQ
ncbi:MAG: hypothetical protein H6765_11210 [Candidatus Peribacteria bacterium]|nr:MAG: hypothetical protein H6765_11210 [Candidatus Peribacteria bacterium]